MISSGFLQRNNMLSFPNAKINLGLFITEKRQDGFHNLETIFYPVQGCKDSLEIIASDRDRFIVYGKEVSGNHQDNLIVKALDLVRNEFEKARQPLKVILYKSIPMGAGLGGGSADAAFMLRMLDTFFELNASPDLLASWALSLGSDCPFFLHNQPVLASGRGEIIQPLSLDLSNYSIQLVCPAIHISTAQAFAGITPQKAPPDWYKINDQHIAGWKELLKNDFEEPVFQLHPVLGEIKEECYRQGALYASMTGTGSTIFAIFPKARKAVFPDYAPALEIFYQE